MSYDPEPHLAVRDVLALVLTVVGVAGLVVAAAAVDWRAGLAVASIALAALGFGVGYR